MLSLQHYNEGNYEEAISAAQSALALKPDYAEAFNNICAASNKLGRYEEAAKACEQALRIKPDFLFFSDIRIVTVLIRMKIRMKIIRIDPESG